MDRYEYTTSTDAAPELQETLDELGKCWELFAVFPWGAVCIVTVWRRPVR